jgi:eukaryotic-like serine/threonine-protein kinase
MDPQPTPPGGLVAGKYEVLRLIGRGGMGSVWEGRHVTLGTRVAIKFIEPEYAKSKEARSRFDTEARAAAALRSKHAIQIYDHGVTDDERPYMVMELLTGEALDERLDRTHRISLADTARILGQVCRALQRAHEAGIIHRDLKPENIFLVRSPDDDEEIAKVLDFGIAKIKAPPGEDGLNSSTKTGAVLGTPYYMAPEQARGLRTVDTRADQWSLGVIAYKCVTGALPFDGESVGDLLVKICTAPPPVPSMFLPGIPAAFDAWFARTMERDPGRRFASATELADALALAAGVSLRRPGSQPSDYGPPPSPVARYPGGAAAPTPYPGGAAAPTPYPGGAAAPTPYPGGAGASMAYAGTAAAPTPYPGSPGAPTPYPGSPGAPTPYPGSTAAPMPLTSAGLTSAPFVTSASIPRNSRIPLFAVLAAALLGASIGVVAVVKMLAPSTEPTGAGATASASAPLPLAGTSPATSDAAAGPVAATSASSARPGASARPAVEVTSAGLLAGAGHAGPARPAPSGKAMATTPASVPPTARPAAAKPPPPSSDPGY